MNRTALVQDWTLPAALLVILHVGCTAPAPVTPAHVDRQQKLLEESAQAAFAHADYERAVTLYRQCLSRAYLRDDSGAVINASFNVAASLARLRKFEEARVALSDAKAVAKRGPHGPAADVVLLEAFLAYRLGLAEEAEALVRCGVDACGLSHGEVRPGFTILQAHLAVDDNDAAAARTALDRVAIPLTNQRLAGEFNMASGRVLLLEGTPDPAAAAFDAAADHYRSMGHYTGMAEALAASGRAHGAGQHFEQAAERYLRAGRSARLLDMPEHGDWLQQAVDAATRAQNSDLADQARRWQTAD